MRINELFNKSYSYQWTTKGQSPVASFKTSGGDAVTVYFEMMSFKPVTYNISFERNDRVDVSNEGDAFAILSTVMKVIKEFVASKSPDELVFHAQHGEDELSRANLYGRMLKKFAASGGYDFEQSVEYDGTEFVLTKQGA